MVSKQNQSSNGAPSEYVKGMEKLSKLAGFNHQSAIVFSVLSGEIKELEKRVDDLEALAKGTQGKRQVNYIVTDETESSESDYEFSDTIILPKATISKMKRKYPGKRKNVSQ